jgi:4,5-DOPA dioxygenase extradiol
VKVMAETERMPVLFIGHGSPMNAIEDNAFSRTWRELARSLPRPKAILCISAHWETAGTRVTAVEAPPTIHDFGGFPRELFEAQYPAPGSPWLAGEVRRVAGEAVVEPDEDWGLDHGCWSVLKQMYPAADIPVVQMSLDENAAARAHYEIAGTLAPLRRKEILILASGNLVHNLGRVSLRTGSLAGFNDEFGFDWAIEANNLFKELIEGRFHDRLVDFRSLGPSVQLAIPTAEHYLPMLHAIALRESDEPITWFNDTAVAGSLTMTSFRIGTTLAPKKP